MESSVNLAIDMHMLSASDFALDAHACADHGYGLRLNWIESHIGQV
jgi:hypothetical protein